MSEHVLVKSLKIQVLFDEGFVFGRQLVCQLSKTLQKFDEHIV